MKTILYDKVYFWFPDSLLYSNDMQFVLQVIAPQPSGQIGGADTHVLQLAAEQMKTGLYMPVVLFKRNQDYEKMLLKYNIPYICGIYADNDIVIAKELSFWEGLSSIRIIHSHQYDANFLTCTIKDYIPCLMKIPTVMTCHGWVEHTDYFVQYTKQDFESYKYADALIAVCEKDLQRLKDNPISSNKVLACIQNGVRIPNTEGIIDKGELCNKLGIPPQKKIIAYVGRLAYEKRVDLLLQFTSKLALKRNDFVVLIAGEGAEHFALEKLRQQLFLQDIVYFLGFVVDPSRVYMVADFLMLTSDTEGTPRCVLESMAYEKMVMATNVGGVKEIIKTNENGVLIEAGDVDGWVDQANSLLDEPTRIMEMNRAAKKTVVSSFSLREMCIKINCVYDIIMKRKEEEV